MQAPKPGPVHRRLIILILLIAVGSKTYSQSTKPLVNAFAHNDYWHKHPLNDALANGFTQVEADVYLRDGKLIVAHFLPMLSHHHTLENLYLKPLKAHLNDTVGAAPMVLMIDIKSDANKTYAQLATLLEKYRPLLSCYENGVFVKKRLTVVLSGHKPIKQLTTAENRIAFLDEDLMRVKRDTTIKNVFQMASCKYSHLLKWNGKGTLPELQRERLCEYVTLAHKQGERVRLWASPDKTVVWKALLSCGVDLINTDKLSQLKDFLLADGKPLVQ